MVFLKQNNSLSLPHDSSLREMYNDGQKHYD